MINLYNQVPSIYTSASRDFQYLSWLYNVVLNNVKHNVDDLYNLPTTRSNPKLTELLAMTLGFKVKRNYDEKQLTALVAILPSVLKYKGTSKAILMAAKTLVKATGSLGEADVEVEGTEIVVTLPKDLIDVTLFLDLLNYILPAGMTCRVVRKNKTTKTVKNIQVKHSDILRQIVTEDLGWKNADGTSQSTGLSSLYNFKDSQSIADFTTANIEKLNNALVPNVGLLDNVIIPTLADSKLLEIDGPPETVVLYSTETDTTGNIIGHKKLYAATGEDDIATLRAKNIDKEL
jgi:hypothetical protein